MRNKNAKCVTTDCSNEHDNCVEVSGNGMESLSVESDLNSEKSLPINKDESCLNEQYSYDGSESEGSMPAPHLYPESTLLENASIDNALNDNSFIEEDAGYCPNNSMNLSVQNIAGSNKRKRANPIKLEMVVSKISSNKDNAILYSTPDDIPLQQDNNSALNSFCSKVQKLE